MQMNIYACTYACITMHNYNVMNLIENKWVAETIMFFPPEDSTQLNNINVVTSVIARWQHYFLFFQKLARTFH